MVYESDFYTTRRPYSRPTVTSYSVTDKIHTKQLISANKAGKKRSLLRNGNDEIRFDQRREVPWHKVPTVPRPSQVPVPFTVYGSRYVPVSRDGAVYVPRVRFLPERTHRRILYTTLY